MLLLRMVTPGAVLLATHKSHAQNERHTCGSDLEEVRPISGAIHRSEGKGLRAGAGSPVLQRRHRSAAACWRRGPGQARQLTLEPRCGRICRGAEAEGRVEVV